MAVKGLNVAASFRGRLYVNVIVVPSTNADQFEKFCKLNKSCCPLLQRSAPGDTTTKPLVRDSDIRTLLPFYHVLKNGHEVERVTNLTQFPWNDMVAFYIASISHHIEEELIATRILDASEENMKTVPHYKTNIMCKEAGAFGSPLVVCMFPIPKRLLERTVAVTSRLETLIGTVVHIGDPSVIGIKDITKPYLGNAFDVDMDAVVPVFWPSSLTAHAAVKRAGLPLTFTDNMEQLIASDTTVAEFIMKHPPVHVDTKPQVVTLKDKPFTASLVSESAVLSLRGLEKEIQDDIGERGIAKLHIADELLRAALVLSHSSFVGIHFGFPCNTNDEFPDETDGPLGAIALGKALKALGKEVTFIASYYHVKLVQVLVETFLRNKACVVEFTPQRTHGSGGVRAAAQTLLFHNPTNQMSPKFDVLVAIEAVGRTEEGRYMTMKARDLSEICKVSPVDEVFIQAKKSGKIATIGIGDGGNEIGMGKVHQMVVDGIKNGQHIATTVATDYLITSGVSNWGGSALVAALAILSQCPVHSPYVRRGILPDTPVLTKEVLNTVEMEEDILKCIVGLGVCDGILQKREMSVDGQPFHPVHKEKLQRLLTIATLPIGITEQDAAIR